MLVPQCHDEALRSRRSPRVAALGIVGCLAIATAAGCSDDDKSSNSNQATAGTTGGTTAGISASGGAGASTGTAGTGSPVGTSGRSGAAGVAATAGMGGKAGDGTAPSGAGAGAGAASGQGAAGMSASGDDAGTPDVGMMDEDAGVCEPPQTPLNLNGLSKCSPDLCPAQDSVCVPRSLLSTLQISEASLALLADCDASSKCVPTTLANQAGRAILTKCASVLGAEGRCLSPCVPQVALQASQLPRANCQGSDLCAPCYDPRTGAPTGACSQGCDPGPTEPPKTFPTCCSSRGLCVPPALAGDQAPNLNRDSCSAGDLCAPKELTDPTFKPKTCNSIDGGEGRCMSTCIGGAIAKQRDRLPTQGCGSNEVCAPCFDPITGEDTGACTVNGDQPARAKYTFPRCCSSQGGPAAGVCVSPDLAGDQASILRRESCAAQKLCAPTAKASDPDYRFPVCYTALGAGACVAGCILDPLQAAILGRETCAEGELCAPCTLLGAPTGACD